MSHGIIRNLSVLLLQSEIEVLDLIHASCELLLHLGHLLCESLHCSRVLHLLLSVLQVNLLQFLNQMLHLYSKARLQISCIIYLILYLTHLG